MKYLQTGAYRLSGIMRLTLGCTLVFLLFMWATSALLYFQRMSLAPASVVAYYRGSEQEFAAPRTYGSLLEQSHAHFAMMSMVLLLLTHLAIFIPWPVRLRVTLVIATFGASSSMMPRPSGVSLSRSFSRSFSRCLTGPRSIHHLTSSTGGVFSSGIFLKLLCP